MTKTEIIIQEIKAEYSETPAERAARHLYMQGIREEDFANAQGEIADAVSGVTMLQVRNAVRDLERGFQRRK